jgi:hypothetical protein
MNNTKQKWKVVNKIKKKNEQQQDEDDPAEHLFI